MAIPSGKSQPDSFPRYDPELGLLVAAPPTGAGWLHEIKRDGYRIGAAVHRMPKPMTRRAALLSRRGLDWTEQFPAIAAAAATLPVHDALLDGEVVILLPDGRDDFHALQNVGRRQDPRVVYFAFDALYLEGESLLRLLSAEINPSAEQIQTFSEPTPLLNVRRLYSVGLVLARLTRQRRPAGYPGSRDILRAA